MRSDDVRYHRASQTETIQVHVVYMSILICLPEHAEQRKLEHEVTRQVESLPGNMRQQTWHRVKARLAMSH